ncbi:MAG: hypothetical protein ACLFU8_14600 [Anaerolineales bacterium]
MVVDRLFESVRDVALVAEAPRVQRRRLYRELVAVCREDPHLEEVRAKLQWPSLAAYEAGRPGSAVLYFSLPLDRTPYRIRFPRAHLTQVVLEMACATSAAWHILDTWALAEFAAGIEIWERAATFLESEEMDLIHRWTNPEPEDLPGWI